MATIITPNEGEKVLFTIRKNFFILAKPMVKFILLFIISVLGFFISTNEYLTLFVGLIFLFALSYGFYHFILWFYDVYIITNQRVISVAQKSMFQKEYSEINYTQVKDVTYAIRGVFATIFHFGSVYVKGIDIDIELSNLSYPDEVQEMIKKLSENSKKSQNKDMTAKELIETIMKNYK